MNYQNQMKYHEQQHEQLLDNDMQTDNYYQQQSAPMQYNNYYEPHMVAQLNAMNDNDTTFSDNEDQYEHIYDVNQTNQGINKDTTAWGYEQQMVMDEGAGVAQEAMNTTQSDAAKYGSKKEMVQMYIDMGHECARLMHAKCISEKLSNSRGEDSLRFTCRHGHNFYLAVEKVKQTLQAIVAEPNMTGQALDTLNWCNKCENYVDKLRAFTKNSQYDNSMQQLEVLFGVNAEKVTVHCYRCTAIFHVDHDKKIDQVGCNDCRQRDEEAYLREAEMQQEIQNNILREHARKNLLRPTKSARKEYYGCTQATDCNCGMCVEYWDQAQQSTMNTVVDWKTVLEYREKIINSRAQSMAEAYFAAPDALNIDFNKVFLVYKFAETPEPMIMDAIMMMGEQDTARAFFKKVALMVHPDKNGHPLANDVFKKISKALEVSKTLPVATTNDATTMATAAATTVTEAFYAQNRVQEAY